MGFDHLSDSYFDSWFGRRSSLGDSREIIPAPDIEGEHFFALMDNLYNLVYF